MKRHLLLFILLQLQVLSVLPFSTKRLSIKNGLSQQSVLAISQDDKGRMLFGTAEGLNVYDGHTIKVHKGNILLPKGQHMWLGNYVTAIKTDDKGNVFVISDNNLFFFNIKENIYKQLTSDESTAALALHEGKAWYIDGNLLKTYDAQQVQATTIKTLVPKEYTSLMISQDRIYVGSTIGLDIYTKDFNLLSSELKGIHIFCLFESSDGELWIGSGNNGLFRYKNQRMSTVTYTPHNNEGVKTLQIRDFLEDTEGNIWFATRIGLQKYEKKTNQFLLINSLNWSDSQESYSIYSLFRDKQGNIWIGTYANGVNYFNPNKDNIEFNLGGSNSRCSSIHDIQMDKHQNLWITDNSYSNGIRCINPEWQFIKSINTQNENKLNSNIVKSLVYHKGKNLLYAGLYMGGLAVHNLNNNQTEFYQLPNITKQESHSNIIYHIEIWNDKVYLSTPQAIYQFEEKTHTFNYITTIHDKCNDFKITPDSIIVAREKNGIQLIPLDNPKNKEAVYLEEFGYHGEISRLLLDPDGVYMLTLGNGIIHYNLTTKELTHYSKENSKLPSNYCYSAAYTQSQKIIITSEEGVALFNPVNKTFAVPNNSIRKVPIVRENSLFVSEKNDIYVSHTNGITKLTEKDFEPVNNTIFSLFFTDLYVNNQLIRPEQDNGILSTIMLYTKRLDLGTHQNNIKIGFAHSDYINEQVQQEYAYKLEGADKNWNFTTIPSVHYSNLRPGKYTLYVKLQNQENSPVASISIHIATPLYARWWAIVLYLLTLTLIIRMVYTYKTRQRELALSLKNERFEKQKIEQLNNEKLVFFTNISHEFRTPLTLIHTYADSILMQQGVPTTIYNTIYKLKKNAVYMNNLITELLDFRRYSQHQSTLQLMNGDYEQFIQELYLNFQELAKKRHITFTLQSDSGSFTGWFDSKALEKVFINLLSNAFKYTPEGGSITLSIAREGNRVITRVADTGIGISPDDAKQLFNRFYQGQNQQGMEHNPGTGIGLALTKSIVDSHHGEITIESEEGKGSIFCVKFPMDKQSYVNDDHVRFIDSDQTNGIIQLNEGTVDVAENPLDTTVASPLLDDKYSNKLRTVLLVEDNHEVLLVLKELFEKQYQVILATNGKEGLEKAIEYKPHLIISDVMMPEMNGTEMCTQIKSNINICHIPIILLTALGGVEHNLEGLSKGADDYITKPFNSQLLLARANNIIRNRLLIQSQINKNLVEEIDLSSINPLDQSILRKVEEVLKGNIDNSEFDVSDLIKEIGMGRSALFAKFKALTGMTPNHYILNYRFKYAISLFHHHPELNISEVSDRCGFSSPSYFGKCFKKRYGTSPQVYKDQLCEKATDSQGS